MINRKKQSILDIHKLGGKTKPQNFRGLHFSQVSGGSGHFLERKVVNQFVTMERAQNSRTLKKLSLKLFNYKYN